MAAAPAGTFSFSSVEPLLLKVSPAAAAARNDQRGWRRPRGGSVRPSAAAAAASKALLPISDFDLQVALNCISELHVRPLLLIFLLEFISQ
jgi:hypothetical protein